MRRALGLGLELVEPRARGRDGLADQAVVVGALEQPPQPLVVVGRARVGDGVEERLGLGLGLTLRLAS